METKVSCLSNQTSYVTIHKHQCKDCATKEDEDAWGKEGRKLGPEAAVMCQDWSDPAVR